MTTSLRAEYASDKIHQFLQKFAILSSHSELLEDATCVFTFLNGAVLTFQQVVLMAPLSSSLRSSALKALYEVCRADISFLSSCASFVGQACAAIAVQESSCGRVAENAELLAGLCQQVTTSKLFDFVARHISKTILVSIIFCSHFVSS